MERPSFIAGAPWYQIPLFDWAFPVIQVSIKYYSDKYNIDIMFYTESWRKTNAGGRFWRITR